MTKTLATLCLLAACGDDGHPTVDAPPVNPNPSAVWVAGDFNPGHPGTLARLDVVTSTVTLNAAPAGAVGDDPVLRKLGNELFVVNRLDGNSVTILDATTLALVEQLGTGAGSNPQDVAVVGDKLYVPTFHGKGLAVLTRGSSQISTIDLSVDDIDGEPNCASVYLVGSELYVACELLDTGFKPRGDGKVYVVDTGTDTVKRSITLAHPNPFGLFARSPESSALGGDLVIATDPLGAGCVERVTIGGDANGCVLDDTKLGGYAARIDFQTLLDGSFMMFMASASSDGSHGALRGYDIAGDTLWDALSPDTEVIPDLVTCPNNTIVVADTHVSAANGLRVYANFTETTTAPLSIGLDPKSPWASVCY